MLKDLDINIGANHKRKKKKQKQKKHAHTHTQTIPWFCFISLCYLTEEMGGAYVNESITWWKSDNFFKPSKFKVG